MRTAGIIPARYGSSRLPGKPLLEILGKPMLWWVYEQAKKTSRLDVIYAATDDERILAVCKKYGIPAVMTRKEHGCAATRLQEASRQIQADFYVQINGDEPMICPEHIDRAVPDTFCWDQEAGTNIITAMRNPAEVLDVSNIKVVFDRDFRALYMSRHPIPCPFADMDVTYYKHVGIIGYTKRMLEFYARSSPGWLEKAEGIDTMRFLDYGKRLQFLPVEKAKSLSVDTDKDYRTVKKRLEGTSGI